MRLRAAETFDSLRELLLCRAEALGQPEAEAAALTLLLFGFSVLHSEQEERSGAGEKDRKRTAFLLSVSLHCGTFIVCLICTFSTAYATLPPLLEIQCELEKLFAALRGVELEEAPLWLAQKNSGFFFFFTV